jgi:hypothetical protein
MPSKVDAHHVYSEVWRFRATPEQKAKLFEATPDTARGSGTFWRDIAVEMAEMLIKLRADEITVDDLSKWMAELATEYLQAVKDEAQAYLKATEKPSKDEVV